MHSSEINWEGELRSNRLTHVYLEKWSLKRSVHVLQSDCSSSLTRNNSFPDINSFQATADVDAAAVAA